MKAIGVIAGGALSFSKDVLRDYDVPQSAFLGDPELAESCNKFADAALAALKEAGLVVEQDWQPMENAPRDGTEIIAWRADAGSFVAFYGTCENLNLPDSEAEKIEEETFFAESWWALTVDGACRIEGNEEPTHWRPLPAPPATGDAP